LAFSNGRCQAIGEDMQKVPDVRKKAALTAQPNQIHHPNLATTVMGH